MGTVSQRRKTRFRASMGASSHESLRARPSLCPCTIATPVTALLTYAETKAPGIFGVPLRQSIVYANVAISLVDDHGKSYIYGYVPIVVAKCGVFLKEKGTYIVKSPSILRDTVLMREYSNKRRGHFPAEWVREAHQGAQTGL